MFDDIEIDTCKDLSAEEIFSRIDKIYRGNVDVEMHSFMLFKIMTYFEEKIKLAKSLHNDVKGFIVFFLPLLSKRDNPIAFSTVLFRKDDVSDINEFLTNTAINVPVIRVELEDIEKMVILYNYDKEDKV